MEPHDHKPCQWQPCGQPATKHVRFGFRTFGSRELPSGQSEPYTVLHRNLCETHLEKARLEYLDVTEYELGHCRSCVR
jgi:hypothetical protein